MMNMYSICACNLDACHRIVLFVRTSGLDKISTLDLLFFAFRSQLIFPKSDLFLLVWWKCWLCVHLFYAPVGDISFSCKICFASKKLLWICSQRFCASIWSSQQIFVSRSYDEHVHYVWIYIASLTLIKDRPWKGRAKMFWPWKLAKISFSLTHFFGVIIVSLVSELTFLTEKS